VKTVIDVHSRIATGTGVAEVVVAEIDRRRYEVIDLFKADLGLKHIVSTRVDMVTRARSGSLDVYMHER
jgi:hypothetical protein